MVHRGHQQRRHQRHQEEVHELHADVHEHVVHGLQSVGDAAQVFRGRGELVGDVEELLLHLGHDRWPYATRTVSATRPARTPGPPRCPCARSRTCAARRPLGGVRAQPAGSPSTRSTSWMSGQARVRQTLLTALHAGERAVEAVPQLDGAAGRAAHPGSPDWMALNPASRSRSLCSYASDRVGQRRGDLAERGVRGGEQLLAAGDLLGVLVAEHVAGERQDDFKAYDGSRRRRRSAAPTRRASWRPAWRLSQSTDRLHVDIDIRRHGVPPP